MATASTPGASIARPMHEIDANLRLTAMLLECLHRNEGRELLYFSSGGALYADAGGGWSTESDIVRPRSYHGVAKLASEHLIAAWCGQAAGTAIRSEEHTSELQSLMRISYAVFCLKKKIN